MVLNLPSGFDISWLCDLGQCFLKCAMGTNPLGVLLNCRFRPSRCGWGLKLCLSRRFPGMLVLLFLTAAVSSRESASLETLVSLRKTGFSMMPTFQDCFGDSALVRVTGLRKAGIRYWLRGPGILVVEDI